MDESEARRRLAEYLPLLKGDIGYQQIHNWLTNDPVFEKCSNGEWLATHPFDENYGVLIKKEGTCIPFFGALGRIVSRLGWLPASREYFLASSLHGRYQIYEQGLAVWEEFSNLGDIGYPVAHWESLSKRAKRCLALVAFFDLRGFTAWSAKQDPDVLQDTIEKFEIAFQTAFSRSWCHRLFSKGTGDGLMVISEAGSFGESEPAQQAQLQPGHCKEFCAACAQTVESASHSLPAKLAVGCGITLGEVNQLYLLGRPDYIGSPVNDASKIQAIAYGEVCVSLGVARELKKEGIDVPGTVIPGKGRRVATKSLIKLVQNNVTPDDRTSSASSRRRTPRRHKKGSDQGKHLKKEESKATMNRFSALKGSFGYAKDGSKP